MSNWYIIPSDSDIMHHGVKGMRWGVRNDPKPSMGGGRSKSGSEYSSRKVNTLSRSSVPTNIKKSGLKSNSNTKTGMTGQGPNKFGGNSRTITTPVNSFGGAVLTGGGSLDDLKEAEAAINKLQFGHDLTEADKAALDKILSAMSNNKAVYDQFLNQHPYIRTYLNRRKNNDANPRNARPHYRTDSMQTIRSPYQAQLNRGHSGGAGTRY